jgi:hypothetical protein
MDRKGFTNHSLMGSLFLSGMWFALYLPRLIPFLRMGGPGAALAWIALFTGCVLGPVVLFIAGGDEIFGILGIVSALAASWGLGRLATFVGFQPRTVEAVRIGSAALVPVILFAGFMLVKTILEKRSGSGEE